jgi:acetyl-CoA synthetase
MITPLPGITAPKPGAGMTPFPGISADVVDSFGKPVPNGGGGFLTLTEPCPEMLRGIWGDDERYRQTYWSRFDSPVFRWRRRQERRRRRHLAARACRRRQISRATDPRPPRSNPHWSRIRPLPKRPWSGDRPDDGQTIVAFVTVKGSVADDAAAGEKLIADLRDHVASQIGKIAGPRQILLTWTCPRPVPADHAATAFVMWQNIRNSVTTTLADPTVVNMIDEKLWSATGTEES